MRSNMDVVPCTSCHSCDHLCRVILQLFKTISKLIADTKCGPFYIWSVISWPWRQQMVVALCTSCRNGYHLCQVLLKSFQQFKSYAADTKYGLVATWSLRSAHRLIIVIICVLNYLNKLSRSYRADMNCRLFKFCPLSMTLTLGIATWFFSLCTSSHNCDYLLKVIFQGV